MSTLELLQLQNEHNDNFFGQGDVNMNKMTTLYNTLDKDGDGFDIYIEENEGHKIIFIDCSDECGYSGGSFRVPAEEFLEKLQEAINK